MSLSGRGLAAAAAAAFVAVPHAIHYLYSGVPIPPGKRLDPRRLAKLWWALAQQLSLITVLPRYLAWRRLYADGGGESVTQGVGFGSRFGRLLDVYRAPPGTPGPTVVFIYGGAWGSGSRQLYAAVGHALTALGASLAVIPDYPLYPSARCPEMLVELGRACLWAVEHADGYSG